MGLRLTLAHNQHVRRQLQALSLLDKLIEDALSPLTRKRKDSGQVRPKRDLRPNCETRDLRPNGEKRDLRPNCETRDLRPNGEKRDLRPNCETRDLRPNGEKRDLWPNCETRNLRPNGEKRDRTLTRALWAIAHRGVVLNRNSWSRRIARLAPSNRES
jgi:hypothetical protein